MFRAFMGVKKTPEELARDKNAITSVDEADPALRGNLLDQLCEKYSRELSLIDMPKKEDKENQYVCLKILAENDFNIIKAINYLEEMVLIRWNDNREFLNAQTASSSTIPEVIMHITGFKSAVGYSIRSDQFSMKLEDPAEFVGRKSFFICRNTIYPDEEMADYEIEGRYSRIRLTCEAELKYMKACGFPDVEKNVKALFYCEMDPMIAMVKIVEDSIEAGEESEEEEDDDEASNDDEYTFDFTREHCNRNDNEDEEEEDDLIEEQNEEAGVRFQRFDELFGEIFEVFEGFRTRG